MAFSISMIAGPAVGAVIGYFTNYIAVKMLFRPLHPIYIGTWQLPFTPGIIPKGKARLAKTVGEAVGDVLLTKEDFEQLLLSEQMQETVKNQVRTLYQKGMENQDSLRNSIEKLINPEAGNLELANSERGNSAEVNSELANSERGNSAEVNSELANSETGNPAEVNLKKGNLKSANSEKGNSESENLESANSEKVDRFLARTADTVGGILYKKIVEMDLGSIIGEKVTEIIRQKTQGTLLAMMLSEKMLLSMKGMVEEEFQRYLTEHGEEFIRSKTEEEIKRLAEMPVSEIMGALPVAEEELERVVTGVYQRMVTNYFGSIMEHIPISRIVEEKIQAMDVKEVEKLTLSVMQKELNSIVNLGALIGLIIGCVNLLF